MAIDHPQTGPPSTLRMRLPSAAGAAMAAVRPSCYPECAARRDGEAPRTPRQAERLAPTTPADPMMVNTNDRRVNGRREAADGNHADGVGVVGLFAGPDRRRRCRVRVSPGTSGSHPATTNLQLGRWCDLTLFVHACSPSSRYLIMRPDVTWLAASIRYDLSRRGQGRAGLMQVEGCWLCISPGGRPGDRRRATFTGAVPANLTLPTHVDPTRRT
jgi:hypothetical protein